jgi:hypothetical protein
VADCERLHDGLLDQPVNALSSLAYVAAGLWVWRHDRPQGIALMAVGAGSVAYHGAGGGASRWLHDSTIVVVAALAAFAAPRVWGEARVRPRLALGAVGAFALALPFQAFGRAGGPLCRPDSVLQAHAAWHVLTATALGCVFVVADRRQRRVAVADGATHNPAGLGAPSS